MKKKTVPPTIGQTLLELSMIAGGMTQLLRKTLFSAVKVDKFPNYQSKFERNSENLQDTDDVRFSIEGDGDIEDIDLNEAYELSEEEAAQLIVGLKFTSTFADIVDNKIAKIFKQNSRERAADP